MNVPMELLDAKAEAWWTCVFHAAWQGALVGGVLVMVIHLGRRWPGPLRYWLLTLALLKFAFPPLLPVPTGVFSAVGPRPIMRERALEPVARFSPVELDALEKTPRWTAEPMPSFADVERQTVASSPRNSISSPALQSAPPLHWKTWLMLAHAAGGLAFLSWLVWQVSRLSRVARRAYGLNQGELYEQFSLLSEQFALRRRPRLMVSAQIHTPIAFGLLRPTVMLPAAVVEKLPLSEVRVILAHELAHYQRGDLWVNWLQLLLLAVWWFHPVVWLLNRALRQVREDCCDDFLLAQGLTSNEAYCDVLVRAAAELSGKVPIGATLGFAEQMHPLGRRVARIMDRTIRRCHRVPALGVLALLALGGLLLPGLKSQETRSIGKETGPRAVPARSASSSPTAQDNLEAATTTEPLRTGTIRGPEESKESKSAAELFKQLDMFQSRLKRSHASLLDEFVHLQPSVVPFLIQQLEDQNQPVEARRKAAWLLSEMGAAARPALPTLLKALEDDDAQVTQEAANVLGAIGPEAKTAIPALIEALKFKNQNAARALVKIAPDSPQVAAALIEAFEDKGYAFRDQLLYVLSDLKTDLNRLETALVAAQHEPEPQIRSTSAYALYRIGAKSKEALAAIRAWQRENARSSEAGGPTVPELIEKLRNLQDPMEGLKILQNLTRLGPNAGQAVPALIEYLKDPSARYRGEATRALAEIGPAAKEAVPALLAFLKNSSDHGRSGAVSALGAMGPAAKEAVPALIEALTSDERGLSINAARSLGLIGPAAKDGIPALKQALTDPMPLIRLQAAASLWRIDPSFIPTCVPLLIQMLERPPKEAGNTSFYLSKVLGEIGPPARDALPALVRVVEGTEDFGRWNAATAICRIDPARADGIITKMVKALEDETNANRGAVAYALGDLGPAAKSAVPTLTAALKEEDANLREQAARALEKINH